MSRSEVWNVTGLLLLLFGAFGQPSLFGIVMSLAAAVAFGVSLWLSFKRPAP